MNESSRRWLNILRYIVAIPIGFFVFYLLGELLIFINNWTYIHEVNTVMAFFIVLVKNIGLIVTTYLILPRLKKRITTILSGIMMVLSVITAYIYIITLHDDLASIYILQVVVWIGIIVFINTRLDNGRQKIVWLRNKR